MLAQAAREWVPRLRAAAAPGPRALVMAILARTCYRRLGWWEVGIDPPPPVPAPALPLESGFLDERHVDELVAFRPEVAGETLVARFRRGELCYACRHEGRLVTTVWMAPHVAWITYLDTAVRLHPGTAYWYDSYSNPEYRGLRLASTCSLLSCRSAAERGIRVATGTVLPENRPGTLNAERIGMHRVGTIGWVGIGPLRRRFRRVAA